MCGHYLRGPCSAAGSDRERGESWRAPCPHRHQSLEQCSLVAESVRQRMDAFQEDEGYKHIVDVQ